jgi:hypothetical protein
MPVVKFSTFVCFGLVSGCFIVATSSASAQSDFPEIGIAGGVGIFIPTDSEVRNLVGTSFIRFSVSPRRIQSVSNQPRFTLDFDVISANRNGNRILVVPITGGITQFFGRDEDIARPYGSLRAGLAYLDYGITRPYFSSNGPPGRYSSRTVGFAAGLELGLQISNRARVSATYSIFSPSSGFRFDGLSFEASYVLFRL